MGMYREGEGGWLDWTGLSVCLSVWSFGSLWMSVGRLVLV
jgi:hypothetical protein